MVITRLWGGEEDADRDRLRISALPAPCPCAGQRPRHRRCRAAPRSALDHEHSAAPRRWPAHCWPRTGLAPRLLALLQLRRHGWRPRAYRLRVRPSSATMRWLTSEKRCLRAPATPSPTRSASPLARPWPRGAGRSWAPPSSRCAATASCAAASARWSRSARSEHDAPARAGRSLPRPSLHAAGRPGSFRRWPSRFC